MMAGVVPAINFQHGPRPTRIAYERKGKTGAEVKVYNYTDAKQGFVVVAGENIIGYSEEGVFDPTTAAPGLIAMLESAGQGDSKPENGKWTPIAPLANERGYAMWNQDSPFNDLCPEYEIGKKAPSGCVATAMAQVMYYHQWPEKGIGSHTYSPAILYGNTLTADFGATEYKWESMQPYYGIDEQDKESRAAVAELMLHCGVAVEMVYYTQSGALDYDVPPALVNYFGYDRSLAYRKREHYGTNEWLRIIHDELESGRPVLAYGKSKSGGHAYVFDGMDSEGFIHVNWGWGGMSNGYFNTSALTPPMQGIGGADGGFNYSQRIITGIRPAEADDTDCHVEVTSTEALTAGKKKIGQGEEVKIKLTGKVFNHGWQDAKFDYALILENEEGEQQGIYNGPTGIEMAKDASGYAPDFGHITIGNLKAGNYRMVPAVRATGGKGEWIPVRDEYIGYPNTLKITATDTEIAFSNYDYFDLEASDIEAPATIWAELPTLITTKVENKGDVEYHGEIRAVLMNGNSQVASTSNYLIDLDPGEQTEIRFTDSFSAAAGTYTLALLNDDGQKIGTVKNITVKTAPELGKVETAEEIEITEATKERVAATVKLRADGIYQGLVYAFIYDEQGKVQQGCLYPEYISLEAGEEKGIGIEGEFENGQPGKNYQLQIALYSRNRYTFLEDENSTTVFTLPGESEVETVKTAKEESYKYYDFNGFEVNPKEVKLYKKVRVCLN